MNLSLEKVFLLRTFLYIKNLIHFHSVIYIDKIHIYIQLSIYNTFKTEIHPSFVYMLLWYQHRKELIIIK